MEEKNTAFYFFMQEIAENIPTYGNYANHAFKEF